MLSFAAGLIGGLIIGIGGAFAAQALDPRLRREDQLRRLYRIPILARIPKEKSRGGKPLRPTDLSPPTAEAYRTLRGLLGASRSRAGSRSRTILVTGSSPSEGKSTTAINLASSLAAAGHSVILIEADLRRPAISSALGLNPRHGVVSVLIQSVPLADALVPYSNFGPSLNLLLADGEGGWISELFALPAAREMLREAGELADYVIIDSPPLTDVIDALPLAVLRRQRADRQPDRQDRPEEALAARRAAGRERDQAGRVRRRRHRPAATQRLPLLRRAPAARNPSARGLGFEPALGKEFLVEARNPMSHRCGAEIGAASLPGRATHRRSALRVPE